MSNNLCHTFFNWTTDRASDLVIERKRGRYGVCRKSKQSLRLYTPYGSEG